MVIFNGYVKLPQGKTHMCIMCSDTGWWLSPTPLKNHGVKVSWDDDIPNIWKVIKFMFQTTNQYMSL